MIRVESIEQLEAYVNFLIESELCVMPIENYGINFFWIPPLKKTHVQLKINLIIVIGMVVNIVMKKEIY